MQRTNMVKGYLFVIASAFLYGCMPLGAKYIYAEGVNALSLVLLRNILAIPILAVVAKLQGQSLSISKKALIKIGIIGALGCCLTPILLFSSYQYLSSGTATVFHFIYPTAVVLGGIILLKERARASSFICVALCTVGICLFYNPSEPIDIRGSVLALLSGITYAFYILFLSYFRDKDVSGTNYCFYIAITCSITMSIVCILSGKFALPATIRGWALCVVFSITLGICAVMLFQAGTFIIGGQRASILSTVEPITSILAGALFLNEAITARTFAGSFLVVLASILVAWFDMKSAKNS